jgi:hypothetical protein
MANAPAQQTTTGASGSGKMAVYIIAIVAAIVIIGVIYFLYTTYSNPSIAGTTTLLQQSNTAPIYMSPSDAQILLGSPIINLTYNYSTTNLYNATAPENITLLESLVPQFTGNATNGWLTFAFGSNSQNASIQYFVIQTANATNMSALLAQAVSSTFPTLPNIQYGSESGMNYTYESYSNSTAAFQVLVGSKNGYVAMAFMEANNFTTNQSEMAQIVSENI